MIRLNKNLITNLEGKTFDFVIDKQCKEMYYIYIGNTFVGFIEKIKSKWWYKNENPFETEAKRHNFNTEDDSIFKTLTEALDYIQEHFSDTFVDFGGGDEDDK